MRLALPVLLLLMAALPCLLLLGPSARLWADHQENPVIEGSGLPVRYLLSYTDQDGYIPDELENGYSAHKMGNYSFFAPVDGITALKVEGNRSGASIPEVEWVTAQSHTTSIWFRPDHLPGQNGTTQDFPILSDRSRFKIRLNADGKFYAAFYQEGSSGTISVELASPQYQEWQRWYHLCQVVDYTTGQMHFYVDGQSVGSTSFNPALPPDTAFYDAWQVGYLTVGGGRSITDWSSRGYFWDARIYDEALTSTEVENLYVPPDGDSDGDGLMDGWEMIHFGDLDLDSYDDVDGDGYPNIYEFLYGANPTVPSSPPTVDLYFVDFAGDGIASGWKLENGLGPFSDLTGLSPSGSALTYLELYQIALNGGGTPTDANAAGLIVYIP